MYRFHGLLISGQFFLLLIHLKTINRLMTSVLNCFPAFSCKRIRRNGPWCKQLTLSTVTVSKPMMYHLTSKCLRTPIDLFLRRLLSSSSNSIHEIFHNKSLQLSVCLSVIKEVCVATLLGFLTVGSGKRERSCQSLSSPPRYSVMVAELPENSVQCRGD
jgi:hypothetical protein